MSSQMRFSLRSGGEFGDAMSALVSTMLRMSRWLVTAS